MKKTLFILIISILFLSGCQSQSQTGNADDQTSSGGEGITRTQLANADGKNGNPCYVAVSGRVYEIKNSSLWVDGIHTESEGDASCGRDLTSVIRRAPHGVSILTSSPKVSSVGNLVD